MLVHEQSQVTETPSKDVFPRGDPSLNAGEAGLRLPPTTATPLADMSTNPQFNPLYAQLTKQLIQSGEWDRIRSVLAAKLNENGWVDDVRDQSKERARAMEPLSFRELFEETKPTASSSIPQPIRREIIAMIKQQLEKQCE
ncbi:hypothetical protein HGRIS_010783 [Hohenbuehelia grisea]|uniref:Transcription and mRNA export factor SUS1 n=1 Tax=Hohenbuehelia grisea TaxID=104357 RepID=A0ABR3IXY4_9AGAR